MKSTNNNHEEQGVVTTANATANGHVIGHKQGSSYAAIEGLGVFTQAAPAAPDNGVVTVAVPPTTILHQVCNFHHHCQKV